MGFRMNKHVQLHLHVGVWDRMSEWVSTSCQNVVGCEYMLIKGDLGNDFLPVSVGCPALKLLWFPRLLHSGFHCKANLDMFIEHAVFGLLYVKL